MAQLRRDMKSMTVHASAVLVGARAVLIRGGTTLLRPPDLKARLGFDAPKELCALGNAVGAGLKFELAASKRRGSARITGRSSRPLWSARLSTALS